MGCDKNNTNDLPIIRLLRSPTILFWLVDEGLPLVASLGHLLAKKFINIWGFLPLFFTKVWKYFVKIPICPYSALCYSFFLYYYLIFCFSFLITSSLFHHMLGLGGSLSTSKYIFLVSFGFLIVYPSIFCSFYCVGNG